MVKLELRSPRDVALDVVGEIAPDELPVFEFVSEPYLTHPRRMGRMLTKSSDEPLGIGGSDISGLITPALAVVATTILSVASGDAYQRTKPVVWRIIKRAGWMLLRPWRPHLLNKKGRQGVVITVTDRQLSRIRKAGVRRARDLGIDSDKANAIVDAIVAQCLELDERIRR